jgi:hypothetical protein
LVRDQTDDPANKTLLNISPMVPLTLMMKPYIREFLQIELNGKQMPANIKFQGSKDIFNIYISTSDQYPDETNCHQAF